MMQQWMHVGVGAPSVQRLMYMSASKKGYSKRVQVQHHGMQNSVWPAAYIMLMLLYKDMTETWRGNMGASVEEDLIPFVDIQGSF